MHTHPLIIIPTPIGNLEDITYRAVRLLKEADYVLAEDTRTSAKLMKAYGITTPLRAFHMHNEHALAKKIAADIANGANVAMVTDAGTPGISDPGYLLIRTCLQQGLPVSCLPGATAAITALVASGLPCDRFRFEGFLPPKKGRLARLQSLLECDHTTIYYEAPNRLLLLLLQVAEIVEPTREVVVARELTKLHEAYVRGTITEVAQHFQEHSPLGEIVVLVAPAPRTSRQHVNKYKTTNN